MKFINYLSSIAGVEIYPLISLVVFVLFFTILVIYVIKTDKKHIDRMSDMPLEKNEGNLNYANHE